MYQNMTLEQIKLFLKYTKQDIIITKISRNIVACEFHIIGVIEVLKSAYPFFTKDNLPSFYEEAFWLKNPNIDSLLFASMAVLGAIWYSYQNSLNDLYETMDELNLEKDKKAFVK